MNAIAAEIKRRGLKPPAAVVAERAYGNAIVPQVAAAFVRAYMAVSCVSPENTGGAE